jgi:hypothetical protein
VNLAPAVAQLVRFDTLSANAGIFEAHNIPPGRGGNENRGAISAMHNSMTMSRKNALLSPGARPELRIPHAAAQTRIVSVARIRLDSWKSVRPFKGIFCDDISEFESYMPRQVVGSPPAIGR